MSGGSSLYEEDFVRWSEVQAAAIRAAAASGANLPLDWQNIAEEVESLGKSLRSELRSRVALIVEHLLKLEFSPSAEPRRGCIESVTRERSAVEELIEENPSLRPDLPEYIRRAHRKSSGLAVLGLEAYGELTTTVRRDILSKVYGQHEVLGDLIPASAAAKREIGGA